jgi:gamma-glutamyltranspeptidase / glutathione hydrolase
VVAPLRASRPELQRMQDEGRFFGHKLVAAPATLAALSMALARYGTKPLAEVMAPAIAAAETGVVFSPAMQTYVNGYLDSLRESPYLAGLLLENGLWLWGLSHTYCFPDLACTLRRIAEAGPEVFYSGEIADAMVADMERNGGYLRRDDLARVKAIERAPFVGSYRGYEVVSFPLPGAGGAVVEALQILDAFPQQRLRENGVDRWALQLEATRLAIADDHSVKLLTGDAARILLDRARAQQRAGLILPDRALTAKELDDTEKTPWSERDTTQLSVVDARGNAVSVTQTLGRIFGAYSATWGLGFPYNGLLEGYDLEHFASRSFLLPLREPFTTQAPTIVRRDGRTFLVLGSVGSGRITSAIVLAISDVIDQGMSLREAVEAPRVLWGGNQEARLYLEIRGRVTEPLADELEKRGYSFMFRLRPPPRQVDENAFGCVNAIQVLPDGSLVGVGDPRRQGVAVGAGPVGAGSPAALAPACWRTLWALPGAPARGSGGR